MQEMNNEATNLARSASELVEATGMAAETVLQLVVMILTTINIWIFRNNFAVHAGTARALVWLARRGSRAIMVAWVIILPVASAVDWKLGADRLAASQPGAWEAVVTGVVALACWPVAIMALRKRRMSSRNI